MDAEEKALEIAFADGFVNAVFRTDELRAEVVERLKRIAANVATNGTTAAQGNAEQPAAPIQWKGSVQQLAWVLRELAEGGWIGYPAQKGNTTKWKAGDINASAFAKAMAPHFKEVKEKTLAQELKPGGGTVPAADVEGWEIPKRPE